MTPDIEAMVRTAIQTQVVTALKSIPEALDELVKAAITAPVPKPGGYGYEKLPYLDMIVGETIRSEARKAVEAVIAERRSDIESAVRKTLSGEDIVQAMAKAFIKASEQSWRIEVNFGKEKG